MDFHLKRGVGGELRWKMPVHGSIGDGGKKLKACEREERQDTEAIFIDSTSVALLFPSCATQSPHEEAVITKSSSGYCTLLCCNGRMGFVLYRSDDLIPPNSTCRMILR